MDAVRARRFVHEAWMQEYVTSVLLRDAELRKEAAKERGVRGWLETPAVRERPNVLFVANTLRGVCSANRRTSPSHSRGAKTRRDDDDGDDGAGRRRRRRSTVYDVDDVDDGEAVDAGEASGGMGEDELAAFLGVPRKRRGRGGTGMRADEPGPFMSVSHDMNGHDSLREIGARRRVRRVYGAPAEPGAATAVSEAAGCVEMYAASIRAADEAAERKAAEKARRKDKKKDKKREKKPEGKKEGKREKKRVR